MSDRGTRKRALIVPIFIPNEGCPYRCIYCHQVKITSQPTQPVDESTIKQTLHNAINATGFDASREPEVAFYGGTFTRLPVGRMKELLEAAAPFLREGWFKSIRVSTRPDSLQEEPLRLMRKLGVATVELGTQSMDDAVLKLSRRGHTSRDTIDSVHLLKTHGFKVGIQLMPGLPGDSEEIFLKTVGEVIKLRPDMVRLYPTLVIKGTELARWYMENRYHPLSLDAAIRICQESCARLEQKGIPVIRIGMMSSPALLLRDEIMAGPWHSAFGFLVRSGIHQDKIASCLHAQGVAGQIKLRVPSAEIPLVRGYKNRGLRLIEEKTGARVVDTIGDDAVPSGQVEVDVL
ncbi:MAG: radical SAM protein [Deltaproteobacteria bacterium]|nr:MAG: radical SAM protein [Deltaproteobacteria bacterium]